MAAWENICDDLIQETDVIYEEEISRNPYDIKIWVAYLRALEKAPTNVRYLNYERSLKHIPSCFKIWNMYLLERRKALEYSCIVDDAYQACNDLHERALVHCAKMPRLWIHYLELLIKQKKITQTRRTIDNALKALPITQHHRIWNVAIQWLAKATSGNDDEMSIPEATALVMFRRYLMLQPDHVETYVAYLLSRGKYDEAAVKLTEIVNDDAFVSIEGKTSHQLWMDLCDVISRHPEDIKTLKTEAIIRNGLNKFTDEVGRLWNALADYFVRLGFFEKARDIYEESIEKVQTVHDFSLIWEAYTKFMDSWLNAMIEKNHPNLELLLARNEALIDRRPEILSSVLLRQNPHNVHQWLERAKLFSAKPEKVIETFAEAIQTVDVTQAVGKPNALYTQFAGFYEKYGDLENARVVFRKGTEVNYRGLDDLASVWCDFVEFELRHIEYDKALQLIREAINLKKVENGTVQARLHRSVKLWSIAADLEESFGTHDSTKATYDRMFELKVITPQIIINYAHYLEERHWYEECFAAFERGVKIFKRPHSNDLWLFYLQKFVDRFGGRKLERARDLFENALVGTEGEQAVLVYSMYAKLEEEYGLARHSLDVYERLTKVCGKDWGYKIYCVLISKTQEFFGVNKSREIYERAVENLPEGEGLIKMCMKYARTESALGEIDRARAIFTHCSQFSDPKKEDDYWSKWRFFEVQHGNEDTFRDMLRIKRSLEAQYAQMHFNTENIAQAKIVRQENTNDRDQAQAELDAVVKKEHEDDEEDPLDFDAIVKRLGTTERESRSNFEPSDRFVGSRVGYVFKMGVQGLGYYEDNSKFATETSAPKKKHGNIVSNPEEIDLGMDLEELDVPAGVFGGLAEAAASMVPPEPEEKTPKTAQSDSPQGNKRPPKGGGKGFGQKYKKPRQG